MSDSLFSDIKQGLQEAIAHERGQLPAREARLSVTIPAIPEWNPEEIRTLRLHNSMTQRSFAAFMGVSIKTVEAWESGRNRPNGSAARLMQVMASDVHHALFR